jgi:glycosyltransferase involved in cell wall biosynthesis
MNKFNNIHFLLAGSGDLKEKYQKKLAENTNVTFLPRIELNQVKYFLNSCDILYLSTKESQVWDFGQSMNKVVEYMLAEKPIIATYSGYPSMINESGCGVFLSTQNPDELRDVFLEYSKLSKNELRQIGENGRKWIFENRTYDKLAAEYFKEIETLFYKLDKSCN